jgi:hypothetical protein
MNIDILSLIIGGVLWELISAYGHFVLGPKIRKWKMKRKGGVDADGKPPKKNTANYADTNIGFNSKLQN